MSNEEKGIILLVEDNPDDEVLTLRALRKSNVLNEVVVCRDGAEALEYLHGTDAAPKDALDRPILVVLLDLKLPKIDGHQVLKAIRARPHTRHLPVVILTSSDEDRDVAQSYALNVNSYVPKPVEFDRFITAVGEIGLYWCLYNRTPEDWDG